MNIYQCLWVKMVLTNFRNRNACIGSNHIPSKNGTYLAAPGCKWIHSPAVIARSFLQFRLRVQFHMLRITVPEAPSRDLIAVIMESTRSHAAHIKSTLFFFCHTKHTQTLLSICAFVCCVEYCAVAFTAGHSAH
jgi:hypothetical protein